MKAIFDIAAKDLLQMLRDRKIFMFMLIMPIAFTLLFGFAFSGSDQQTADNRLPVGFANLDNSSSLSLELEHLLASSQVIRLDSQKKASDFEKEVAEKKLAAAILIPEGYGASLQSDTPLKLVVLADTTTSAGVSAQTEIDVAASRILSAVRTAQAVGDAASFDANLKTALAAWQNPPVRMVITQSDVPSVETEEAASSKEAASSNKFAHSSPGMILQFAVAGLLTCAQVIVAERKNRCLQRLMTTSVSRPQILLGHYLAILTIVLGQFVILIVFGQFALKLTYFTQPLATFLVMVTAAMCISALGLLIGVVAKGEDQAIMFSLICMFLLAGLGGAWVPLEFTGAVFQSIGHVSPLAWAMDGFKNVVVRGLGTSAALLPAAALCGYAVLFFALAGWRFKTE